MSVSWILAILHCVIVMRDVARLKTLAFHLKWKGYDESFNSWEPWKNLRETEQFHHYLIANGILRLIPVPREVFRTWRWGEEGSSTCGGCTRELGKIHEGTSGDGTSLLISI